MGGSCCPRLDFADSSLDPHWGEHSSRLSDKTRHGPLGVQTGQSHVQNHPGQLQPSTYIGCLRLPLVGPTPKIHVLAQGSSSCGSGCPAISLGRCDLSVPTCSPAAKGEQENQGSENTSNSDLSTVANSTVVGSSVRDVGGTSHGASILQVNIDNPRPEGNQTISRPVGGFTCFRQEFILSNSSTDLNQADLDFLANHLAPNTAAGYGYVFRKFRVFCENLQADPLTYSPTVVVKYLRHMSESGAEYSTVNYHRSGISKFHTGVSGTPIGEHPLVSQAVKAVFRLRPPLPKYKSTFDIVPVLQYVRTLQTDQLSLQQVTYKAFFLAIYTSISRVSSIVRLGPTLVEHRDSLVLHFVSLEKQARVGHTRGFLQLPQFLEDPELCPVWTVLAYYSVFF